MKKQVSRHVDAVLAALAILDCFLKEPVLSLRQVIKMTGLTRNRIMRLAGSLEARGYLNLDFSPAKITLGPKCLRLGKVFESHLDLVSIARPILQRLAQETGESASLYMRDGMERVVVAREEGTQMIRYSVKEGQRMPLARRRGRENLPRVHPPGYKEIDIKQQSSARIHRYYGYGKDAIGRRIIRDSAEGICRKPGRIYP